MGHDIETLRAWIRVMVLITAICVTSVPLLYSFAPWRRSLLGRIFMLQALSFATAFDLTALFTFWTPKDILVIFWVDATVLTLVALATASLSAVMIITSNTRRKAAKNALQR